jgi:hypothetical protein
LRGAVTSHVDNGHGGSKFARTPAYIPTRCLSGHPNVGEHGTEPVGTTLKFKNGIIPRVHGDEPETAFGHNLLDCETDKRVILDNEN